MVGFQINKCNGNNLVNNLLHQKKSIYVNKHLISAFFGNYDYFNLFELLSTSLILTICYNIRVSQYYLNEIFYFTLHFLLLKKCHF